MRLIIAAAAALLGPGSAAAQTLPLTGPPIVLTQPHGEGWRESNNRGQFQMWTALQRPDGARMQLSLICTPGRGSVLLWQDAQPQKSLRITMVVRAGDAAVLAEEAEFDITGYSTRWVEKAPFLTAMNALRSHTVFHIDMEGGTRRTRFTVQLGSAKGFHRMAQHCPGLM